jgi:putative transposase
MRRPRYLAPWHRNVLEANDLSEAEAEALAHLRGKPAIYHCVSRIVNRDFVLQREEKEHFVKLMRSYEQFSQVRVLTFCVMTNHFHILVETPAPPEDGGRSWSDERLLGHLGRLYSAPQMAKIRWDLEHFRSQKNHPAAEALRQKYFDRMWNISAFMKVLKQRFTQWFNRKHERRGYLWEERFKSVLVEDGHAARTIAAYIDLNPVRAGLVKNPEDYRWCGYAEAVAGKKTAREGLRLVLFEKLSTHMHEQQAARSLPTWREVVRKYRVILLEDGEERSPTNNSDSSHTGKRPSKAKAGISRKRVAAILAKGGQLSEAQLLRCKVRYFLDGLVIGTERFVNGNFTLTRPHFSAARSTGARKMHRIRSALRTMRDLRKNPVST